MTLLLDLTPGRRLQLLRASIDEDSVFTEDRVFQLGLTRVLTLINGDEQDAVRICRAAEDAVDIGVRKVPWNPVSHARILDAAAGEAYSIWQDKKAGA